jgi:hypothetical protein
VNRYRMWAPDVQRVLRIPPIAGFIRKLGKRPARHAVFVGSDSVSRE